MKPKFKTILAWEQAERLMQPALIRTIDNIRKQLDALPSWQGTYEETTHPFPGYQLHLSRRNSADAEGGITVDLWQVCFQVCFRDYNPAELHHAAAATAQEVDIDTSLIDESGEVDWQRLETKTQHLVQEIFANLPA